MTKYVINTVEIVKRVYVVDAFTEKEALDKHLDQAPDKVEFIGELVYSIETINEYEYQKDWVQEASGRLGTSALELEPVKDYYDQ